MKLKYMPGFDLAILAKDFNAQMATKNYILSQDEVDRFNDELTCYIFDRTDQAGKIKFKDWTAVLNDTVNFHIKINKHLTVKHCAVGFDGDDFIRKCKTGMITFSFLEDSHA